MRSVYKCPDEIFDLFKKNKTKGKGRARAILWLASVRAKMKVCDYALMPNPLTGKPEVWEAGECPDMSIH